MQCHFRNFNKISCPQARRGFTVVEIMMAVMLVGVLGSYAVISVRGMFPRMRVERASSRLAFQLQLARSEAIANNQLVYVWLEDGSNEFRVWVDHNRNGEEDAGEVSTVMLSETRHVAIDSDWGSGLFNAYGQFIVTPGQRTMETVETRLSPVGVAGGERTLILRGSGAITQR